MNHDLQAKLEKYERHLRPKLAPKTVRRRLGNLRVLLEDGIRRAPHILAEKAETCSPYHVRDLHRDLVSFGRWAHVSSLSDVARPRAGGTHRPRAVFSADEVSKLAQCSEVPEERRLFWRLMYRLGLRVSEARRVTKGTLTNGGRGHRLALPQRVQKAGREDAIEVPEDLAADVLRLAPDRPSGWKKWLGPAGVEGRVFDRDLEAAGIGTHQGDAHRTPYDLRSFFISELFRRGVPLPAVTVLARHRDPATTLQHYARVTAEEARDQAAVALEGL